MNRLEPFNGFHLDDDLVFHEKINSVPAIEGAATIDEWEGLLPFDLESPLKQLEHQARFNMPIPASQVLTLDERQGPPR